MRLTPAQGGDTVLATQPLQHDADLAAALGLTVEQVNKMFRDADAIRG